MSGLAIVSRTRFKNTTGSLSSTFLFEVISWSFLKKNMFCTVDGELEMGGLATLKPCRIIHRPHMSL